MMNESYPPSMFTFYAVQSLRNRGFSSEKWILLFLDENGFDTGVFSDKAQKGLILFETAEAAAAFGLSLGLRPIEERK